MSNIEYVKEIVRRIWSQQDLDSIDSLMSQNVNIKSPIKIGSGVTCLSEIILYWRNAFPDVKSQWLSAEEVEPNTVVVKWSAIGTHNGCNFLDVPPSGKTVQYNGETTYTFENNKLVAYEANVDIESIKKKLVQKSRCKL